MTIAIETYALDDRGRRVIPKDPGAVLDYSTDWGPWLTQQADSFDPLIPPTTFTRAGSSVTILSTITVGAVVSFFASGGTVGNLEPVTFHIETVGGRIDERTIYLKILER